MKLRRHTVASPHCADEALAVPLGEGGGGGGLSGLGLVEFIDSGVLRAVGFRVIG